MSRNIFILLLSALVLSACASRTRSFAAVDAEGELNSRASYVLESTEGREGAVTVKAYSERDVDFDGREVDTVRFQFAIDNASSDRLDLPLAEMRCVDDTGRQLTILTAYLPPDGDPDIFQVAPNSKTSVELLFDAGGPDSLATLGSVTLDWSYRFREASIPHKTRFLPIRYVSRPSYYYPSYGFGFGFYGRRHYYGGHHHHRGW